jgi:hypothetical protein
MLIECLGLFGAAFAGQGKMPNPLLLTTVYCATAACAAAATCAAATTGCNSSANV